MKSCPGCGCSNEDAAQFCISCGAPLHAPYRREIAAAELGEVVCARCGLRVPIAASFGTGNAVLCVPCNTLLVRHAAEQAEAARLALAARPPKRNSVAAIGVGALGLCLMLAFGTLAALPPAVMFIGWFALCALVVRIGVTKQPSGARSYVPASVDVVVAHLIAGAISIALVVAWSAWKVAHGSCPHVYAFDGRSYRLDADPLSGAFFRGAERDDLVRLDHLRPIDGRYRLEIRDELREADVIDAVELVVVDHDAATEVLPTQDGRVLGFTRARPPRLARDGAGGDRLADVLAADDGAFVAGARLAPLAATVTTLELAFERPEDVASSGLALRAHATPFAEEALARYLGAMGPGLAPLMHAAEDDSSYPFRQRIDDEMRRLGLGLSIELADGDGEAFLPVADLTPIGPAIQRTQAVPFASSAATPPNAGRARHGLVRVRLRFTSRFWAIDEVRLGAVAALTGGVVVKPQVAQGPSGPVLAALSRADGDRAAIAEGGRIALEFAAPAESPGASVDGRRTVLLRIRGYYEAELGPGLWLNPLAVMSHRLGWDTLPQAAARLSRAHPELVRDGVR
jgi:hypothetical protein